MRLGHPILKRSRDAHQVRFNRDELIADGAPANAVNYLFDQMALDLGDFREPPKADRESGEIGHQRYTLTRYPFLAGDNDAFVIIRHQWALDRLWGGQLYFEMWSNLGALSKSLADRFNGAMIEDYFCSVN
jgi:hypothetical protein